MQAGIVRLLERIVDRQASASMLAAAFLESAATRWGKDDGWVVMKSVGAKKFGASQGLGHRHSLREPAPSREACADSRKVNYHAGALRAHVRQHGLAKVDRAPEVRLPNESRSRFVRLLDRFDEADTCVVHEHVDATSFGGDAGDDIAYRGAIGDVEPANDNGQRFARDRVAKPMIDRWVAHRRMDRVATAAERERRLVTDTGSTSGDQDRCHGGLSVRPTGDPSP